MHRLELYRCVICKSGLLVPDRASESGLDCARCIECQSEFPFRHNILDTMIRPSEEAVQELRGMAEEAGQPTHEWEQIRIRKVDQIRTFEARLEESANHPIEYYQQTRIHFHQALQSLGPWKGARVLEIGSETDYYFLRHFRDMGTHCTAVNLFFQYQEPDPFLDWPEKTLADMNELPFHDGVFDLVLMSATSHHSPDLKRTIMGVSRVLKFGGIALILSDPIGGWLKSMGKAGGGHDRHALIHENEYSIWKYHCIFIRSGFTPQYLFSEFYDKKLRTGQIHPETRFANLGRLASRFWKNRHFRNVTQTPLLWTAHAVLGFPMNAILRKSRAAAQDRNG
jgi:SAM-dependent methyltransferase